MKHGGGATLVWLLFLPASIQALIVHPRAKLNITESSNTVNVSKVDDLQDLGNQTEALVNSSDQAKAIRKAEEIWANPNNPRAYLAETVKPLLLHRIIHLPTHAKFGFTTRRLHTCSIVSSSGAMLQQSNGANIDQAEAVFRMNTAPTAGYETQVGKKTNFRFGDETLAKQLLSDPTQLVAHVTYVFVLFHEHAVTYEIRMLQQRHYTHNKFYYITKPNLDELVAVMTHLYPNGWLPKHNISHRTTWDLPPGNPIEWSTVSAVSMLTALSMCNSVAAFEMVPSIFATASPYHYYDDKKGSSAVYFQQEHDLWTRLSTSHPDTIKYTGVAVIPGLWP